MRPSCEDKKTVSAYQKKTIPTFEKKKKKKKKDYQNLILKMNKRLSAKQVFYSKLNCQPPFRKH